MKTCYSCGETKPLEEFQKRSRNKDGHTGNCKVCKRLYDNDHYKNNPSRRKYIRENSDNRVKGVKKWLAKYLSENPCIDCGEDDIIVLEFDHLRDKKFNLSNMTRNHCLDSVKAEIEKCVVRCANCHRRKTALEGGWWRSLIEYD